MPIRTNWRVLFTVAMSFTLFARLAGAQAQTTLSVQVDKPGAAINPSMYGVFFEDINFAADGGLYPERVKNGSFEFEDPMMGWRRPAVVSGGAVGGFGVIAGEKPLSQNNTHYLRVLIEQAGQGLPLSNEGFRAAPNNENNRGNPGGIGVKQGSKLTFSVYARSTADPSMSVTVELAGSNNQPICAPQTVTGFSGEWQKYSATIEPTRTDPRCRMTITVKGAGTLDLDMVSLFPEETFKNRKNGVRADLAQMLADLKPGFMRFPGGCIVEGRSLSQRYQWKTTIGELTERKLIMNRWNVEFAPPRNAPDYYESMGLGFFEYFQLCEDIGAQPLPILNCGMACQFNLAEIVPMNEMGPYVQDALDLIEFANGPVTSEWGAKRAAMGHPEPFNLTMIGIGNEQWGQQYFDRYALFAKAIRAKYPNIQLVSGTGPEPADNRGDNRFSFAWEQLKKLDVDLVDEHFYKPPTWFYSQVNRYDTYDRSAPKVFAGEYAAHIPNKPPGLEANTWEAALAEAALLTGIERNADVVRLASYAPLFAHVDAWQWNPNLIWFDNLRSVGTVNYHVQRLFSTNKGTKVLPATIAGPAEQLFACASIDETTSEIVIKVVNSQPQPRTIKLALGGATGLGKSGTMQVMASDNLRTINTLDEPQKLIPQAKPLENPSNDFTQEFPGQSVTIIRIPVAKG